MLRQRLSYVFMLLANLCVFIFTNTRLPLISFAVLIGAPIISYILLRIVAATVKIECKVSNSAKAGDVVKANVNISSVLNIYPGIISVKRNVKSIMFGTGYENTILHELGGRQCTVNIGFTSRFCGMHELSVHNIKLYDAFRLFSSSKSFDFNKKLIIYPKNVRVRVMRRSSYSAESDGAIYDKNRRGNDKSEIFELRDYVPGDNVKSIHWKLSSKLDKPVVREFSRPNNYKTMILCDLSLRYGGRDISYRAISDNIAICGSLSIDMTKNGIAHSICMLGKNVHEIEEINTFDDTVRLRNAVMTAALDKGSFNTALMFKDMPEAAGVSRLIYIAKEYDMETLSNLAAHMDITVITINDGVIGAYRSEQSGGLEIISLNSGEIYSVLHNIAI